MSFFPYPLHWARGGAEKEQGPEVARKHIGHSKGRALMTSLGKDKGQKRGMNLWRKPTMSGLSWEQTNVRQAVKYVQVFFTPGMQYAFANGGARVMAFVYLKLNARVS